MTIQNNSQYTEKLLTKQQWINQGFLYLPSYLFKQKKASAKPSTKGFALYIPYSEIFNKVIPEKKIIQYIENFRASDVISAASKIGITLENHGRFNKDIQVGLVYHLFPKKLKDVINNQLILEADRFVFFEHQLLNIIKLGLLYGSLSRKRNFKNKRIFHSFLKNVLLGICDHLEVRFTEKNERIKGNKEKQVDLMIEMAVRNLYFNSSEQYRYLIGRYYQLFVSIPKRKILKHSPNYIDISSIFKKATRFELHIYISLGFAILTQFAQANIKKGKLNPNNFFINKRLYFQKIKYSKRRAVAFLNKLSTAVKNFRIDFSEELKKTKDFYYSFITLRQKPIINANGYIYFVASLRFLKEKLTAGIYWEIADYLDKTERLKFFRFFGEIFELYVQDIFKRMFKKSTLLANRCFFEKEYGNKKFKRTSDVMIHYGSDLIFIEVNASRLRMIETAIAGDMTAFRKDLNKIIYESAKQISRVIEDYKQHQFKLNDYPFYKNEVIYPMIVTISPVPQVELIWIAEINRRLKELKYLQGTNIAPLQIIDIEELEMMEALLKNGFSLLQILKNKMNSSDFKYLPMKNYILAEIIKKSKIDYSNTYLQSKFTHISKFIRFHLFNVPLSTPFPHRKKQKYNKL